MHNTSSSADTDSETAPPQSKSAWLRYAVLVLFAASVGIGFWMFGSELTLSKLATREAAFRQYQEDHPILIYLFAFLIYVTVTGLSLPGATPMSLLMAWFFGFWRGLILVSLGSTTGATVAFLLSRYLFRQSITNRFGERLEKFNSALQREGPFYLFTLRLIPAVPFFVINAVMGLTPIRVRTFWWVSQLGMLPGTMVYVYAGSRVPNLQTLADKGIHAIFTPGQMAQILSAFALLGLFPLIPRQLMKRISRSTQA
ncbi:MAG: TVP38/TMEM64 family protein [Planctomycetaceae bacterium]